MHDDIARFSAPDGIDPYAKEMVDLILAASPVALVPNENLRGLRPWSTLDRKRISVAFSIRDSKMMMMDDFNGEVARVGRDNFMEFSALDLGNVLNLIPNDDVRINWVKREDSSASLLFWHPYIAYALHWKRFPVRSRQRGAVKRD